MSKTRAKSRTAQHRPAAKKRRYRHDDLIAVDLFSGFGGLTKGIENAGFQTILAANHNAYKTEVHEKNHPEAEHWIADLVDPESADYHSARDLPAADLLTAGVSCVNHSPANSLKAYEERGTLFDRQDDDYEARVTRSERDRATANCVLHYAAAHHPRLILVECTTQLLSWGPLIPGSKKVGDGTTYRWWLKQFDILGYDHKVLYLNSQFFGVGQSRNRGYWAFWDRNLPTPDLEHRPESWCDRCQTIVEAVWTFKTGIPPTGTVDYGRQYNYRCPSCRGEVIPPFTPSIAALDLSDLGTKIGDRPSRAQKDGSFGPLALSTMGRAERCRQRFADFPAVLMPAKAERSSERHLWQPMVTQTSQQETALLSTGALGMAVDNYQGSPRGADQPFPTQVGSETLSIVSTGVVPFRRNTIPTIHAEPMPTFTSDQIPALLSAAGRIANYGGPREASNVHPLSNPLGTVTGRDGQSVLFSGWAKANGKADVTSGILTPALAAEWRQALADLPLEECYFRMLGSHEIGRGCGFDPDFGDHKGTFIVWGSARDRVDGYGNAVTPAVGEWISNRLRRAIHSEAAA